MLPEVSQYLSHSSGDILAACESVIGGAGRLGHTASSTAERKRLTLARCLASPLVTTGRTRLNLDTLSSQGSGSDRLDGEFDILFAIPAN